MKTCFQTRKEEIRRLAAVSGYPGREINVVANYRKNVMNETKADDSTAIAHSSQAYRQPKAAWPPRNPGFPYGADLYACFR